MLRCHTRTNSKGQFKLHRDDSKTHSLLPLTGSLHFRLETTRFNENATRRLQVEAILLQVTEMQVLATLGDWTTMSCVNGCVEGDANPDCGGIVDTDITHATFN
eukprot:scaffold2436_cov130-Alexandrium_tamarense.AAC.2